MKGTGITHPAKYKQGATRKQPGDRMVVRDAVDEVDAYYVLRSGSRSALNGSAPS